MSSRWKTIEGLPPLEQMRRKGRLSYRKLGVLANTSHMMARRVCLALEEDIPPSEALVRRVETALQAKLDSMTRG